MHHDGGRKGTFDSISGIRRTSTFGKGGKGSRAGSNVTGPVTIEEEEVGPEDSGSSGTETGGHAAYKGPTISPVAERTEFVEGNTESGYGTMSSGKDGDNKSKKGRKPPPGRGESYFKEMNWKKSQSGE